MADLPSTDRNLLIALLAFQNNFIDRPALLAAFAAWTENKSRPIAELLVEQKKLTTPQRQLIEALATEHLKQHANDPQQSLAALSSVESGREALAELNDTDLEESLIRLSKPDLNATLQSTLKVPIGGGPAKYPSSVGSVSSAGLRFRILRPHAEGGLGKVSVARDEELNREVALKEIKPKYADEPSARARFTLEAEITGGLEHPGIVPVYGLGTYADGRPFYAMRFIRGESLKDAIDSFFVKHASESTAPEKNGEGEKLKDRKLPAAAYQSLEFRQLLNRFVDVCNAIAYAHARGVLHRDLKPGNIMLGKYGETLVVDWGLAKATGNVAPSLETSQAPLTSSSNSGSAETVIGSAIGTIGYMSPEQAAGRVELFTPATDIYLLGATLFHVLTGHPPHRGSDSKELLRQIQESAVSSPRERNAAIAAPLAAICLKAMSVQASARYDSALDLAGDIEHWLADEPVQAHRDGWMDRLLRVGRRHRIAVLAGSFTLLMISIVSVVAGLAVESKRREAAQLALDKGELAQQKGLLAERNGKLAADEKQARIEANARRLDAEQARTALEREYYAATVQRLATQSRSLITTEPQVSLMLAAEAGELMEKKALQIPGAEQSLRDVLARVGGIPLSADQGHVHHVAVSSNNRWLVAASQDGAAVWDLHAPEIGKSMRKIKQHFCWGMAISPDSKEIALSGSGLFIWKIPETGEITDYLKVSNETHMTKVVYSPDGKWLATAGIDTGELWRRNETGWKTNLKLGEAKCVTFSSDGQRFAAGYSERFEIWKLNGEQFSDGEKLGVNREGEVIEQIAFSPDQQWLATGGLSAHTTLWNLTKVDFQNHGVVLNASPDTGAGASGATCFAFSRDSRWLATGARNSHIRLWNVDAGNPAASPLILPTPSAELAAITTCVFSYDNDFLVTADSAGKAQFWLFNQIESIQYAIPLVGHSEQVSSTVFSPDNRWLITGSHDGQLRLWNTDRLFPRISGTNPLAVDCDRVQPECIGSHPQRPWIAVGDEGRARIWEIQTDRSLRELDSLGGHAGPVMRVAFSHNGLRAFTGGNDGACRLWDLGADGKERRAVELKGHTKEIHSLVVSPDDRWLVTMSFDNNVRCRLWDLRSVNPAVPVHTISSAVFTAFSHGGRWLAVNRGTLIEIHDLAAPDKWKTPLSLKLPNEGLRGNTNGVVAFTPDDAQLIVTDSDQGAMIWDFEQVLSRNSQTVPLLLKCGRQNDLSYSKVSPDGKWLALGGFYVPKVHLWKLPVTEPSPHAIQLAVGEGGLNGMIFSPDSRHLMTRSGIGEYRRWNLTTADPSTMPIVMSGFQGGTNMECFTFDGKWFVGAVHDRLVRFWSMPIADLCAQARSTAGRKLTDQEIILHGLNYELKANSSVVQVGTPP